MKNFFNRLVAVLGAVIIMPATVCLIVVIYTVKFFRKFIFKPSHHS
ncbi:MAG: hypothetical protein HZA28_05745 [Candidatus Omnitrophica bacterium]|nr:hypothetical protein [Candidatus Omnitrophota bacterium]